jgi:hypothetical protein
MLVMRCGRILMMVMTSLLNLCSISFLHVACTCCAFSISVVALRVEGMLC